MASVTQRIKDIKKWIDKIEKAFFGIGDSGVALSVTTRLLGNFLTCMQEKKATANDLSSLPSELLREARLDELFSVNLSSKK